jgi:hypothetical protein
MANINDSFPSKYLKASDIEGNPIVTIASIRFEEVGKDKDMRPIMYFQGEDKGIVLNKTNATNISKLYGDETDDWRGKEVMLGTTFVDFNGQSVEAIRVYPPKRSTAKPGIKQSAARNDAAVDDAAGGRPFAPRELEDEEIPF